MLQNVMYNHTGIPIINTSHPKIITLTYTTPDRRVLKKTEIPLKFEHTHSSILLVISGSERCQLRVTVGIEIIFFLRRGKGWRRNVVELGRHYRACNSRGRTCASRSRMKVKDDARRQHRV